MVAVIAKVRLLCKGFSHFLVSSLSVGLQYTHIYIYTSRAYRKVAWNAHPYTFARNFAHEDISDLAKVVSVCIGAASSKLPRSHRLWSRTTERRTTMQHSRDNVGGNNSSLLGDQILVARHALYNRGLKVIDHRCRSYAHACVPVERFHAHDHIA